MFYVIEEIIGEPCNRYPCQGCLPIYILIAYECAGEGVLVNAQCIAPSAPSVLTNIQD